MTSSSSCLFVVIFSASDRFVANVAPKDAAKTGSLILIIGGSESSFMIKINDPVLAASFGATLATKRSDAENITTKRQLDELVIEPFANPFRVYPLREDYQAFRELFVKQQTACYVLNTGYFDDKKIKPESLQTDQTT